MKNFAVLASKTFIKALVIVLVGLLIAFGAGDIACNAAKLVDADTGEMCVENVELTETL